MRLEASVETNHQKLRFVNVRFLVYSDVNPALHRLDFELVVHVQLT